MTVLDGTIVNVALPSIQVSLGFSDVSLVWVVNAYLLTFGGVLLLAARMSDLFGQRRLFLFGILLFTVASAGCGLANARGALIGARALQGIGGAIVSAVSLSLTTNMFTETSERAKAVGMYGFICSGGGSMGLLLGGGLTAALSWHWIFLINVPIGAAVYAYSLNSLPKDCVVQGAMLIDVAGSILLTLLSMTAVYAIMNASQAGWDSAQTVALFFATSALLAIFVGVEAKVAAPLVPLSIFRTKNLVIANSICMLWSVAGSAWFFIASLYMQLVLKYSPGQVGLAFLPAILIMAIFSLAFSARIVSRFGIKGPLIVSQLLIAAGILLFARAPERGNAAVYVIPGMLLLGVGSGMGFNPLLLAALSDVGQSELGLASGVVSTTELMGAALGLAILASVAAAHTKALRESGEAFTVALNGGYHWAFFIGAACAAVAALLGTALQRAPTRRVINELI